MSSNIENGDSFGNYLMHGIDEIVLPAATSLWPVAIGWQIVAIIIISSIVYKIYKMGQIWWRNRYRREAITQINLIQSSSTHTLIDVVEKLPYFLRATALQAYPRGDVTLLIGSEWFDFLNDKYGEVHFSENNTEQLLRVSYRPKEQWHLSDGECLALINLSKLWINRHVRV
jgi:hypothetical protein